MKSAESLCRQLDELRADVAHEKRKVRTHRRRLREKKAELLDVEATLARLGISVETQAKTEVSHGRKFAGHRH